MLPMEKNRYLGVLLGSLFIVAFNVIFFVMTGPIRLPAVWISYFFIMFSYAMLLIAARLAAKRIGSMTVVGLPFLSIASVYFIAELLVGCFFIATNFLDFRLALSVQIILAAIDIALLVANEMAANRTSSDVEHRQKEIAFVHEASSRIERLEDSSSDRTVNKAIERAYDTLNASSVKSSPELAALETEIMVRISDLEEAVSAGKDEDAKRCADEVTRLTEERNRRVRLLG